MVGLEGIEPSMLELPATFPSAQRPCDPPGANTAHDGRRCPATTIATPFRTCLANAGHDTRSIQDWLGHRSIQHTVRYTELSPTRFRDFWRH
jgi:integrase